MVELTYNPINLRIDRLLHLLSPVIRRLHKGIGRTSELIGERVEPTFCILRPLLGQILHRIAKGIQKLLRPIIHRASCSTSAAGFPVLGAGRLPDRAGQPFGHLRG